MTIPNDAGNPFEGMPIISTYTRAQAIEDGVLIDVTEEARKAGLKFPVAVTTAVWDEIIEPPPIAKDRHETATGRLHDVLNMMMLAIRMSRGGDTVRFCMIATNDRGQRSTRRLWAKCGPGDGAEPVITVMVPEED